MANIIPGKGTLLKKGETTVAQRVTITANRSIGSSETTHLDSETKEYRPTIGDSGEVQCDVEFDPDDTSHQALEAAVDTPVVEEWSIVVPTATPTIYTFNGFVTEFDISGIEVEGNLTASLTIKRTGPITKSGGGS